MRTTTLGMHEVNRDRIRDAVKFLMGLGTNPTLSGSDQRKLRACLRGPFANGMTAEQAHSVLREMGWETPGTSHWDTTSIEAMERTARAEAQNDCSLKIRDQWLEVRYDPATEKFTYKWGKNMVPRHVAETVHATQ
jgi:hypothetical protein